MLLAGLVLALAAAPAVPLEGETVAAVRVLAPSTLSLDRYLRVAGGEPYRAAAVSESVSLLFATGLFEDVVVEAERGPAGLTLVFAPRPAPRLKDVALEGDPVVKPGDLRQLAHLREGEPLWSSRLDEAAGRVTEALVRDGYLEAEVRAVARPAPDPFEGADAVFHLNAGPRARVRDTALEGLPREAAERLRALLLPLRPGEAFRRARVEAVVESLRRQLGREGHWRAAVTTREDYQKGAALVHVAFVVDRGPRTLAEFRAPRLPGGLRRSLETLLRDGRLRPDVVEEASERLEGHYLRRGYRNVQVRHVEERRPNEAEAIVFTVEPGPLATVASVSIEGTKEKLLGLVTTRPGLPLDDRKLEEDRRLVAQALEERGYATATVEIEAPEGGGSVPVVLRARPGPRTRVVELNVLAPDILPKDVEPRELRTRKGGPYRLRDVAADQSDLVATWRNAGHLAAEVRPEIVLSEDRTEARVSFEVSPGPRVEVDRIVVGGLRDTREEVVRREIPLKEDEPLGTQKLLESQRRLQALGLFERVAITELDPESGARRDLVIAADEAPRTTIAYGLGYAEQDLLRASVEVSRRNLFGLDRTLSTYLRGSFRGSRALLTYREPWLFGRRHELFVSAYREEEARPGFSFIRYGALAQSARALSAKLSLLLRVVYQRTHTFHIEVPIDEIDREFANSTKAGPATSLVFDTRDDALEPHRGTFLGADFQVSLRALGGERFLKSYLQAATYRRLNVRSLLALSGRVGLGGTFGLGSPDLLPLPDRFFAGGDYSLRGYEVDSVAPQGGNALLLGGAELRVDASRHLSVALFTEAGNVYPLLSDMDLGTLLYTAGLGLRYKTAFGPLRVDWGYKLNRRAGESPYHFHFTVGHAF
jgi:outer membrane protein insertion porin family